ncbi:MAG: histidine phosphatase family protein [Thermodesulfovibrionales bacterium]|nr:histidine phosphatase family protein [Thermodesulfovibrionales bacterium]
MPKTLFLIRHGETGHDDKKRYKGSIDVPLSPDGERQMLNTAHRLKDIISEMRQTQKDSYLKDIHPEDFEQDDSVFLYSSSLSRAVRSAEIIGERLGVSNCVVSDFRERNFGDWEGMTFQEIKMLYPMEFENWRKDPLKFSPPNGESTADIKRRVIPALKRLLKKHTAGNIVIVAHGGVNRVVIASLLSMPLKNVFRIEQGYGCINIIEFWKPYPVVKAINLVF